MDASDVDIILRGLSLLNMYSTDVAMRLHATNLMDKLCQEDSVSIEAAERIVIDTAKKWCNNTDRLDNEVLTMLRVAVRRLEAAEKVAANGGVK